MAYYYHHLLVSPPTSDPYSLPLLPAQCSDHLQGLEKAIVCYHV